MIIVYFVLGAIAALIIVMTVNTARNKPSQNMIESPESFGLDREALARDLSGMLKIPTITADSPENFDKKAFRGFHEYLEKTYPLINKTLKKEVINDYSLLYKWEGAGSDKKPFLMMAHIDVVPADERTADRWKYPAFSGEIEDGYVWGRGAIDMKGQLCAVMESVEYLLREGYRPGRDIYIALGHDEERMGFLGNRRIAELLKERGVRFEFVIDEGGAVTDGRESALKCNAAYIGICEKGYADLRLISESAGGHASRPPKRTAVGALSEAVVKLEKSRMKPTLNKPLRSMIKACAPYMKFPMKFIASNIFITKPLLLRRYSKSAGGRAMIRTTIAPTMLIGSAARNVLAERAEAVVNCRISPDDSVQKLIKHIKKTVGSGIKVEKLDAHEPSAISPADSEAYRMISQTAAETFGGYVIAPYIMIAATDSRWYTPISDGVYRFEPFRSLLRDIDTMHAAGERLEIDSLAEGTEFFIRLVKKAH